MAFGGGLLLGLIAIRVSDMRAAWAAGLLSSALLVGFSLAAGFSIGPFTIALPVLVTALFVSRGMGLLRRVLIIGAVGAAYWLITWGFGPMRQEQSGALLVLSGLIAAAYLAAIVLVVIRLQDADGPSRQRT
jgi:hypothetical protein